MTRAIDHRTVHRFIPAGAKHGLKTACGIDLVCGLLTSPGAAALDAMATDGGFLAVTAKGQPFDCKRCWAQLEKRHAKEK